MSEENDNELCEHQDCEEKGPFTIVLCLDSGVARFKLCGKHIQEYIDTTQG